MCVHACGSGCCKFGVWEGVTEHDSSRGRMHALGGLGDVDGDTGEVVNIRRTAVRARAAAVTAADQPCVCIYCVCIYVYDIYFVCVYYMSNPQVLALRLGGGGGGGGGAAAAAAAGGGGDETGLKDGAEVQVRACGWVCVWGVGMGGWVGVSCVDTCEAQLVRSQHLGHTYTHIYTPA